MKQTEPQFKLRLPAALKDKLDAAAAESNSTLTGEIVSRLQKTFEMIDPEDLRFLIAKFRHDTAEAEAGRVSLSIHLYETALGLLIAAAAVRYGHPATPEDADEWLESAHVAIRTAKAGIHGAEAKLLAERDTANTLLSMARSRGLLPEDAPVTNAGLRSLSGDFESPAATDTLQPRQPMVSTARSAELPANIFGEDPAEATPLNAPAAKKRSHAKGDK